MGRLAGVIFCATTCVASIICAESPNYFVYVSNERSGDVTVIDGMRDVVVATSDVNIWPDRIFLRIDSKRPVI
jgi:hypothetical protein